LLAGFAKPFFGRKFSAFAAFVLLRHGAFPTGSEPVVQELFQSGTGTRRGIV